MKILPQILFNLPKSGVSSSKMEGSPRFAVQKIPLQTDTFKLSKKMVIPTFKGSEQAVEKFCDLFDDVISGKILQNGTVRKELKKLVLDFDFNELPFINRGQDSKCLRLNNKYVVKTPLGFNLTSSGSFEFLKDTISGKLRTYYGGVLAKLKNVEFLKNADPQNEKKILGIPYFFTTSIEDEIDKYNKNTFPILAELPQKAFDNVSHDFSVLNRHELKFDVINPNNFLIAENSIRTVDNFWQIEDESNSLNDLLDGLLFRLGPDRHIGFNEELIPQRTKIFERCMIAGEKYDLPIDELLGDLASAAYVLNSKFHPEQLSKRIKELRHDLPDKKVRLQALYDELKLALEEHSIKDVEETLDLSDVDDSVLNKAAENGRKNDFFHFF